MARHKLKQFAENAQNPLFFQPFFEELQQGFPLKGKWNQVFFKNNNPIVLELGCGKGEYTVGLAQKYPNKNFIGVDLKGARMWRGATDALQAGMKNVAFVRTRIDQINQFFAANEVDEIWLTFSDPQPNYERRRLMSPKFLNHYRDLLKPGAIIHVKTDNRGLSNYTEELIGFFNFPLVYKTNDLYNSDYQGDASQIQTFYEMKYLAEGIPINYIRFSLNEAFNSNELERLPKDEA